MLSTSHLLLTTAAGLYGLTLFLMIFAGRQRNLARFILLPAIAVNLAAVFIRYHLAWPMLPMYLAPAALPAGLAVVALFLDDHGGRVRGLVVAMGLITAGAAVLFPKDFYLPFIKSQSFAAHLFLLFGIAGRTCFLVSAAWALDSLLPGQLSHVGFRCALPNLRSDHRPPTTDHRSPVTDHRSPVTDHRSPVTDHRSPITDNRSPITDNRSLSWAVWGFAFWTLSMFAGELWSYLGWGTPVVWDDPTITAAMATWFFYICFLHLHLTGTWSVRGRSIYAAAGALVVLTLNCFTELGPFRWLS